MLYIIKSKGYCSLLVILNMWLSAKNRAKIKCAFLHYNWPTGFYSIYKKQASCPLTNWLQHFISNNVNIFTFSVVVLVQDCWAFKLYSGWTIQIHDLSTSFISLASLSNKSQSSCLLKYKLFLYPVENSGRFDVAKYCHGKNAL